MWVGMCLTSAASLTIHHRLSNSKAIPRETLWTILSQGAPLDFFVPGINNPPSETFECCNLLSARKDPETTSQLLQSELNKYFLIGPFIDPPFPKFRANPIGLSERKFSHKTRLIADMSAPHDNADTPSLNSLINKEKYICENWWCHCHYQTTRGQFLAM